LSTVNLSQSTESLSCELFVSRGVGAYGELDHTIGSVLARVKTSDVLAGRSVDRLEAAEKEYENQGEEGKRSCVQLHRGGGGKVVVGC
jgi:hypothetical protein